MGFIIGLLTFFMFLDCVVLVFLILIQLPKKEAGAGLAFGGAASDALFGAGSGNVLTKITKYSATIFFVMAVFLSILQSRHYGRTSVFQQKLTQPGGSPMGSMPSTPAKPTTPATLPLTSATDSNATTTVPQAENTNPPAAGTNPTAPK